MNKCKKKKERQTTKQKYKPTNVGRIALERQARQFNSWSISLDQFFFIAAINFDPTGIRTTEKSKNVLEEKRKIVKQKFCIKKTHTFTIIAMNFVQEQLKKPRAPQYSSAQLTASQL